MKLNKGDKVAVSPRCTANLNGSVAEILTVSRQEFGDVYFAERSAFCCDPVHLSIPETITTSDLKLTPWVICESWNFPHLIEQCGKSGPEGYNHRKLYVEHEHEYVKICKSCGDEEK